MKLDLEKYRHVLDDTDLSEDEKTDYLQTVWVILHECMQLALKECTVPQDEKHKVPDSNPGQE
ncbi:hypothetical protein KAJ83_19140 [Marivibrio halodurans]|uniref:Uncharacterized protein n=1 Tax=Marivibrio halodurans TaxID=2039722 RepID=A0A8J7V497_9PROT|nr:hypothetical protein [Marivibrio halodurans]MBP5859136.1 hypothetical protein [Marivibrio halodurans]